MSEPTIEDFFSFIYEQGVVDKKTYTVINLVWSGLCVDHAFEVARNLFPSSDARQAEKGERRRWTQAEKALIVSLYKRGMTAGQIAAELGGTIPRKKVQSMLCNLGLKRGEPTLTAVG